MRVYSSSTVLGILLIHGFVGCQSLSTTSAKARIPRQTQNVALKRHSLNTFAEDEENDSEIEGETKLQRPTVTETEIDRLVIDSGGETKIVVLGASGKIGRLVVQQLMEMKDKDMTIVAFVRDLGKANWALFDEILVPRNTRKKGPKLKLILGDLVPPQNVAGFRDWEEERDWKRRAKSASKFFGNRIKDYDNREQAPDPDEVLEEALQGASTIISCVGAVRVSNVWTDYIMMPFIRLFRRDASRWCRDPKHPYYVHYESTRKALHFAELEQLKREQAFLNSNNTESNTALPRRIRFIRISDLAVSKSPFSFMPVFTNMIQSMVFRYQDMAERVLEESRLLDTVILRPGDLVDSERDTEITYVQVSETGKLPYPAVVGREDVAALAVAAAMFQTGNATSRSETGIGLFQPLETNESKEDITETPPPFHMTLAVRWCGELDPPHNGHQGKKHDGCMDSHACLQKVLNGGTLRKKQQYQVNPSLLERFAHKVTRRRLKPYAIFVALPLYLMLGLLLSSLVPFVPGYERFLYFLKVYLLPRLRQIIQDASSTATDKISFPIVGRWLSWRKPASTEYISL